MNTFDSKVTYSPHPAWSKWKTGNGHIYIAGEFWYNDILYSKYEAAKLLQEKLVDLNHNGRILYTTCNSLLNEINGHFALIIDVPEYSVAAVDRIRSFPILYQRSSDTIQLYNSTQHIDTDTSELTVHKAALLEFKRSGFTLGNKTLFKELNQLKAGEYLLNDKKGKLYLKRYYTFGKLATGIISQNQLFNQLDNVWEETFKKLVKSLNNAPVYIPLSGGLDSRVILAFLKEFGYKNIQTYTYGIKGMWEIKRAQKIAELLGVDWRFLEFKPNQTRRLYHTQDRRDYFKYAGEFNSTPQIPEYYGVLHLKHTVNIEPHAVFINGQAGDYLTGGHIPSFVEKRDDISSDIVFNYFLRKHFGLWNKLQNQTNDLIISNEIEKLIDFSDATEKSGEEWAKLIERFEWEERQSKYVVNGQRAYEWFGCDWRLPLWSNELMDFWECIPWELKYQQRLFKLYLKTRNIGGVFDLQLPEEYSYQPIPVRVLRKIMGGIGALSQTDLTSVTDKYTRYFMHYAPFYPHISYRQYLQEAKGHRNPVSYWSLSYLKENEIE